ncbi:aminotransferase class I/II-fold pyridoxal phosphate-dependent enzyme [Actinospica durhamensis]|uniref:Aminotransferase n=1 Tax=Actinospica durhamensis TaxID=1508375 RepID=A0A941EK03_9ACTN|nr:aminotransferase class I/II-fold pyridoxal phosphate-dependent enzyme [Actinospica durhamensis]MBR7831937.1 aminotransferase class I/II-fold pyridoxal phosphate-dependent enzyme [Actinospica durhamensis]
MKVANRLRGLQQSALGAMTVRCQELGALNLAQGLSLVPPPASLLAEGARDFKDIGHSYSQPEGLAVFREAVSDKVNRRTGLGIDPATQVLATVGATGALMATLTALLNAGDGVILFEPFFSYYLSSLKMLNLSPEPVRLVGPDFAITEESLRAAVTGRTRAMIICSPNNPSGHRLTAAELEIVSAVADEHDLLVITDEVYEEIYFGPAPHLAAATVGTLKERTVTLGSLGKSFSIPGWRLGYAHGPEPLIRSIRIAADALVVCAPAPLQELGARALSLGEDYYRDLRAMYDRKRRTLAEGFAAAGLSPNEPEGSYYLFVDCSPMGVTTGVEAAEILLENSLVGTVPGEVFYVAAPDRPYVRACFSLPDEVIAEAVSRLVKGV